MAERQKKFHLCVTVPIFSCLTILGEECQNFEYELQRIK